MANVDNQTIAFSTNKEEITWLLNLGEFIWICNVPGEPFKNMLQHCSRIKASFVSDWPGVIVQKCALQLLYQHDQVQFEQELIHCNNLISENRELLRKQQEDQKKINEQFHVDEGLEKNHISNIDFEVKIFPGVIDELETYETETQLGQSDLQVSHPLYMSFFFATNIIYNLHLSHSHSLGTIDFTVLLRMKLMLAHTYASDFFFLINFLFIKRSAHLRYFTKKEKKC